MQNARVGFGEGYTGGTNDDGREIIALQLNAYMLPTESKQPEQKVWGKVLQGGLWRRKQREELPNFIARVMANRKVNLVNAGEGSDIPRASRIMKNKGENPHD